MRVMSRGEAAYRVVEHLVPLAEGEPDQSLSRCRVVVEDLGGYGHYAVPVWHGEAELNPVRAAEWTDVGRNEVGTLWFVH
jgi:hypothetical protein